MSNDDLRGGEVITGVARRCYWPAHEKLRIIEESLAPGESVSAVARRNGVAPNLLVRWRRLMDEGGAARNTRAVALGLVPCFPPVRSPESNGMSEAFVKTLRRDYVRIAPSPDAPTVIGLVDGWITDYNTVHPHSALRMRSPCEFRAALNPSRTVR